VGAEAAISFKKALAGVPDMERLLAQLHGSRFMPFLSM